ncbi:MAG: SDR family NAD(P)-dependent oxidoreductase [Lachnospiraceae bacterium]|nr:SDR family NAD(P)-dependent oxidoreductase [Lachnospiraceae bacterium]
MYVVITGASRGIGKALAYAFASHRYNLILTCKNNIDKLYDIRDDIKDKYKVDVIVLKGNVYDTPTCPLIEKVKKDVYIVINNQAKADYTLLQDIDDTTYREMIDSNVTNQVFTTKYFLPSMIHRKDGLIVNISSIWGQIGASGEVIYSMTKGAIDSFTKSLSKELKDSDIDVIAFSLGMVDTDMNSHLSDDELKDIVVRLDDKKMYAPDDIAKKIYDTVSTRQYTTGDIIEIDNGLKNIGNLQ